MNRFTVTAKKNIMGYVFVMPALLAILLFVVYPVLDALRVSFYQHNGTIGDFVGLYNYKYILSDNLFLQAVSNTFFMAVFALIIGIPSSFIIATLLNSAPFGKNLFKGLVFTPNVTSMVAASLVFVFIFYPTAGGPINYFLSLFGVEPLNWLVSNRLSQLVIVLMATWHSMGYNSLIWLAGLQSISRELYEAAEVDGAGKLKQWIYITIPGVKPIFVFMMVWTTIVSMRRFTEVLTIGGEDGNPAGALMTLVLYIYKYGFATFDFGKASAATYFTFILILSMTIINFKLTKSKE